jgi:hypothetical protein
MSGLIDGTFWTALTELTSRSLLEVRGTTRSARTCTGRCSMA